MAKQARNTDNVGVYKIINIKNNKFYIGSSIDIKRRLADHMYMLKCGTHHSKYLQNSYNKDGLECFKHEILFNCPKEYRLKLEQWCLNTMNPDYNMTNDVKGIGKRLRKKIAVYNLNGKYLKSFNSIKECAVELNLDSSCIVKCCKNKIKYYNKYVFKYYSNKKNINAVSTIGHASKKVALLNEKLEIIKIWKSASRAGKELNICPSGILHVCNNRKSHTKNYKFKFI